MKRISLRELNAKGQLILMSKKVAFIAKPDRFPCLYCRRLGPSSVYLHYYNDLYVVTCHILEDTQVKYDDYDLAHAEFLRLVKNF